MCFARATDPRCLGPHALYCTFCRPEPAVRSDGTEMKRPVIRLNNTAGDAVLTRIDDKRETSIIVRIRPHWQELHAYIARDASKQRCASACRAAHKGVLCTAL